ncbi:type VI secretion system protein TssA [Marinomonas aquiplantarum]|uniref:Type VI secretion system protein ImpA n=1 Tax=Marinomonas aquiplantarum TaxID=491951 RepID=A0A366CVQ8_9GAMM|nr:type VI secretion system protein TssA [Marinomonas aquiplantarum]RBO81903.1 type VI secretion system protein ImpA [Marinomonas aquiplantarum]
MRLEHAIQAPDEYMKFHMGYSLNQLLEPIGDNGVGQSVRHNGVYTSIKAARQSDDPSLPLGVWTHDLRVADWSQVKSIALQALAEKSKDLQLMTWLFEASIHLDGFSGIAPATILLQQMCERYWDTMYPEMLDGDIEFRTNPLKWINDKLTPVIKSLPITRTNLDGNECSWNDWESAQYFEKVTQQAKHKNAWDGPTLQDLKQRLMLTETNDFQNLLLSLEDALNSLKYLQDWLDEVCGHDAPSFADFTGVLQQISDLIELELNRRGVRFASAEEGQGASSDGASDSAMGGDGNSDGNGNNGGNGPISNRDEAFTALYRAADFLQQDDPHSIVPYLIYTACEWGQQSAPDLYKEIFLVKGGQINLFEIMGIES